jgi:galactokinase
MPAEKPAENAPLRTFEAVFGRSPEIRAHAPGRVNLIGEHTDYTGGLVLPTAIPRQTQVTLARRDDKTVRAVSANAGTGDPETYTLGSETPTRTWIDYLQGLTSELAKDGHVLSGFDIRLESDVPIGAGLSSSASLEVAVLRALREAFSLPIDDVQIALLGQRCENRFVGAPCGIMDQMAASLADVAVALMLDTRSMQYQRVPLPESIDVVIVNSGVTHSIAGGEYAIRRKECERATEMLGVKALRDIGLDRLSEVEKLPDPERKRARHIVTENERVVRFFEALGRGDKDTLGKLLYEGHASLRDDFQVSVPEIDCIVEIAQKTPGVIGARLTGGGFGGSVVVLARADQSRNVGPTIAQQYQAQTGRQPTILTLR